MILMNLNPIICMKLSLKSLQSQEFFFQYEAYNKNALLSHDYIKYKKFFTLKNY